MVQPLRSGALQSRGRYEHNSLVMPGHDDSAFDTVPALRSGMKNAAPRPGHDVTRHNFEQSRPYRPVQSFGVGGSMIRAMSIRGWALMLALSGAGAAMAEEPPSVWPKDIYSADPNSTASENPGDEAEGAPAQTVDLSNPDIDWSQLDPALAGNARAPADPKARRAPGDGAASSWSAQDKSNGAAALSVKQSMIPFWDTRVGADLTVARQQPSSAAEALQQKITTGEQQSSGAAWAAMTAPGVGSIWDRTAIEARVDPSEVQSRLGTSLSKSMPFGEQTSLTLQNGGSVTQQGIAAIPGITGHQARNTTMDQSARLNIADTGTSLIAGQTLSSTDDKWLRKIGAEQKLFGGVSVSGSIGETLQGMANKSISAGFKRSW
jgi:hypothetical protein